MEGGVCVEEEVSCPDFQTFPFQRCVCVLQRKTTNSGLHGERDGRSRETQGQPPAGISWRIVMAPIG